MNLFDVADRFASLDRSDVLLDSKRCLHSLFRFSDCKACMEVCPVGAILPGKVPGLDSTKCETCLACLPVCPVGAFAADDAVASLLNAVTHLDGGELELLCEKNQQAELGVSGTSTGIRVRGCLAGLGTGAFLALAAIGLDRIIVRMDACSACKWGSLSGQVYAQINQANQLLEGWGKTGNITFVAGLDSPVDRPLWKSTNPPISRRDLFLFAARQGQIAIARSIENGQPQSSHRPGRNHLRMAGAIKHLPVPVSPENINLSGMGFASVATSEACVACGTCARGCPTNALQFKTNENETSFTLSLSVRNCIGCGMCVHVCTSKTLTMDRSPSFTRIFGEEMVILREGELVKCEQCGVLIAARPDVHLCQFCDYRRSHPFGSMQVPGAITPKAPVKMENQESGKPPG
ncbi:MAG: 4Fe-4S dicluster domain-containing protein [Anaerolineales bacterium]